MSKQFDVVVIGAGPGGYIAAIRSAQLGKKVAVVEKWVNSKGEPMLGGTCTNVGCIPSKALLQSSEHLEHAKLHFAEHGIKTKGIEFNQKQFLKRKDDIVKSTNDGIAYLFKKNKITLFQGQAEFVKAENANYIIKVTGKDKQELTATNVIVATGSKPRELPNIKFDEKKILSNTGALSLTEVPKKLGIIGAGVIGLELGSVWRRLGAEVTIFEASKGFLSAADSQVAKEALKAFTKQGLSIKVGSKIDEVKTTKTGVSIKYQDDKQQAQQLTVDKLILSIGRVPNTDGLKPEAIGLQLDERGFISVDEQCRSNLPNVWAIGDVVRGPMLAHKAEEEAVAVAERIAGQHGHVNFATIPYIIYTNPEIAWVGQTEQELKQQGREYKVGTFPFMANGRARAIGDTTGLVKIIADAKTDEILGAHMVGPLVSELLMEIVVAMEYKASAEDIARICHAHPTLSEAVKEAALAVDKRTLNF